MTEHNLPDKDDAPWLDCMDVFQVTKQQPELSPQAQAVLDAYRSSHLSIDNLAAALRALANNCKCDDGHGYWIYRPNILAIANELENNV